MFQNNPHMLHVVNVILILCTHSKDTNAYLILIYSNATLYIALFVLVEKKRMHILFCRKYSNARNNLFICLFGLNQNTMPTLYFEVKTLVFET